MSKRFPILTVCTGNICRSPLAEYLLRGRLADIPGVTVTSAGTQAMVGHPIAEQTAALALRYGAEGFESHVGRDLDVSQLRDVGLVLTMTREHRKQVVVTLPKISRVVFTVREFARLAEGLTSWDLLEAVRLPADDIHGRLTAAVEVVASRRGQVLPPDDPADDDVIDPWGSDDDVYEASAAQLLPAIDQTDSFLHVAATSTEV